MLMKEEKKRKKIFNSVLRRRLVARLAPLIRQSEPLANERKQTADTLAGWHSFIHSFIHSLVQMTTSGRWMSFKHKKL